MHDLEDESPAQSDLGPIGHGGSKGGDIGGDNGGGQGGGQGGDDEGQLSTDADHVEDVLLVLIYTVVTFGFLGMMAKRMLLIERWESFLDAYYFAFITSR
jgi:hypothetical protein